MAAIPHSQEGDNIQRVIPYLLIVGICVAVALALVEAGDAKPRTSSATYSAQFEGHRVGNQAWQWNYRVWMPAHWIRLAQCESGSSPEPNWEHDTGTYTGAMGFHINSWRRFKPVAWWPARASQATPFQQYRTALAIHARYGFSGWGCWQGAAHAWVRNGR